MQQQNCEAVFENGILRPSPKTKHFPKKGLISQLTDNPIKIEDFQPLTRVEANER
ncbi:hypothetical protein [Iningainema tapete]|uniref:Uncharacterized protein n=1 Tax=Iningainema tapete BLCC-T55 TaxID=2748662 RepID=A0A8J6XLG2_9CYAN|nr:hypothetical protein [Iningainema tapete]MBD2778509.1 hypothetical protein [Iningainema tapete BLCC-T55]